MYALPDEPVAVIDQPNALTMSPRLDYKVSLVKTGLHYFWFRGCDGGGDSLNAGIDGDRPDFTMNNMDETLEQTDSLLSPNWTPAPNQAKTQTVPATGGSRFYRIHQ
jgi:hypothetical protein